MASAAYVAKQNPGKYEAMTSLETVWSGAHGQLPKAFNQANPLADVTDPETGGRKEPSKAIDPMYLYGLGAIVLLILLKKRKK